MKNFCIKILFLVGLLTLTLSCSKDESTGIARYAGDYDGWYQYYYFDHWTDTFESVSMQFSRELHFEYDESTNCIVAEKIGGMSTQSRDFHLIVEEDGSFVSKEKENSTRMHDYQKKPIVSGHFSKEGKKKYIVDFQVKETSYHSDYTQYYGEKTR